MKVAMKMIDPGSQSKAVLCFTKAGATPMFNCDSFERLIFLFSILAIRH